MEEQKEMSQLTSKLAQQLDQMLSGFEQERHAISHKYESDLEANSPTVPFSNISCIINKILNNFID